MTIGSYLLLSLGLFFVFLNFPALGNDHFDKESRSKGILWGWGHSWKPGWPGYGKTDSDIAFAAFHPQMGWFVTNHFELYGEGSLLIYHQPRAEISAGFIGIAGRYYFSNDRRWNPYVTLGGGILWSSLEIQEIDRVFNFQVIMGGGFCFTSEKGPGWIIEFRNHHISNAGTAGENLGVNAGLILFGVNWFLR